MVDLRGSRVIVCWVLAALGCGSETKGADTTSGSGNTATVGLAAGTCRFRLRDGAQQTPWEGRARARMNGSGNLLVECSASDGGPSTTELHFGNATFDGPRTYVADDFSSDGSLRYQPTTSGSGYDSSSRGAACTLVLTEASPLDARGDSVVKGGRIAATFTCTALVSGRADAIPKSYVVDSGEMAAIIE